MPRLHTVKAECLFRSSQRNFKFTGINFFPTPERLRGTALGCNNPEDRIGWGISCEQLLTGVPPAGVLVGVKSILAPATLPTHMDYWSL